LGGNHTNSVEALDNLGYRLTPQRMLVLRAVDESEGHVGVDEIFAGVRAAFPRVSLSTIYRTLDLLEELGLVTKTDLGAGRVQYHRADDAGHHHLVCQSCGHIIDLEEDTLEPLWRDLRERYGFAVQQRHMAIFGVCEECGQGTANAYS